MSVIAWDGKMLAADKMAVDNGLSETVTKIFVLELSSPILVGLAGFFTTGLEVKEWIRKGMNEKDFPQSQRGEEWCQCLMVKHDGVYAIEQSPQPILMEDKYVAAGSGRNFALAAMACGKTAREAVDIACYFSTTCGRGIDVINYPGEFRGPLRVNQYQEYYERT